MPDHPSPAAFKPASKPKPITIIGWMEYVGLPDLGLPMVKSKIDTGARTSAIHAENIELFDRSGKHWVRFQTLPDWESDDQGLRIVEAPLLHTRDIKNTSGVPEERLVIRTKARFGTRLWTIDLSLADRTNMTFPMIVGRSALKNHSVAVHTRRTFLVSQRPAYSHRKDT